MNEDTTKARILEAARQLFVENGFSGTSMGKVAKLAIVNHSLIYHHFLNKEGLWIAVKESIVKKASGQEGVLPSLTLSFKEFLHALLTRSLEFYRKNPDIAKLILWQRIEHRQPNPIGLTKSEIAKEWLRAFDHYQSIGEMDKNHKSEFILTMITSLSSSAALDPNVFIETPESREAYINFCTQVLIQGLAPKPF